MRITSVRLNIQTKVYADKNAAVQDALSHTSFVKETFIMAPNLPSNEHIEIGIQSALLV